MTGDNVGNAPLVNELVQKLQANDQSEVGADTTQPTVPGQDAHDRNARPEAVLASVRESLPTDEDVTIDETVVKQNLEEILIALVTLRDDSTHGKALIEDLSDLFDAQLSPGTVYPCLHDLKNDDVLTMHELVRTKEYLINDQDASKDLIEEAMYQHLALGLFFHSSLQEL